MQAIRDLLHRVHRDDAGEGVISAGIAVLIMALLGAAMWVVFDGAFTSVTEDTCEEIGSIGDSSSVTCP